MTINSVSGLRISSLINVLLLTHFIYYIFRREISDWSLAAGRPPNRAATFPQSELRLIGCNGPVFVPAFPAGRSEAE